FWLGTKLIFQVDEEVIEMGDNPKGNPEFGTGENAGGDRNWTAPVYATTESGEEVTVSFGQNSREGQTLIAKGHVSGEKFYSDKGHDHYGPNGESYADRGAY
ncbi:MAG: hypothetical protein ACLR7M_09955, partial [Varibaculum timonense]